MARRDTQDRQLAEELGWRFLRYAKHGSLYGCPCGQHVITVSSSPGRGRATGNLHSQLRRCPEANDD